MAIRPLPLATYNDLTLNQKWAVLMGISAMFFILMIVSGHADRAWQAYLINFLFFSAIAQGALLFSTLMHTVKAQWSRSIARVADAFAAFFPLSMILFFFLFFGYSHVFPWLGQDLHGKEIWLNLPFLFFRDMIGMGILYGCGLAYLYYRLYFMLKTRPSTQPLACLLQAHWRRHPPDEDAFNRRQTRWAILYMLAFALVLSLLGYDLVMAADPHWFSTLFGAYSFVKAIYIGFGALIMVCAAMHLHPDLPVAFPENQFHDIGKLFFAFCLVWADFFYAQFVVIWYGNIPEETVYIIERTMRWPWGGLAWLIFIVCFIGPFLILINRDIKTRPKAMIAICSAVLAGIWLEHYLLLGPAFYGHHMPFFWAEAMLAPGFFGLLAWAVTTCFQQFPELLPLSHGKER